MESIVNVKDFSFSYKNKKPIIQNLSFSLKKGEMLLLCGENGCGKSTLLRSLKKEVAPKGEKSGEIEVNVTSAIVFQESDKNIIFKSVWEDLIFPSCNYGVPEKEIKARAEEILDDFEIRHLLGRDTGTLSGGEKQLLSLASLMMLKPKLLILDEPLSQLDEDAKDIFTDRLLSLKENGTAIIIAEHNTDRLFEKSDRLMLFTQKGIEVFEKRDIKNASFIPNEPEYIKLQRILNLDIDDFTTSEACQNLKSNAQKLKITPISQRELPGETLLSVSNLCFYYERTASLINALDFKLAQGEISFITGKNGVGKSTFLSIICSFLKPKEGEIRFSGSHKLGFLAQNPVFSFLKDTLKGDLEFALLKNKLPLSLTEEGFKKYPMFEGLRELLDMNPLDLSGGERAKAAVFKLLILGRDILILDEPEKHLDKKSIKELSGIIKELSAQGVCFIIVSHSPDFIYNTADSINELKDGVFKRYTVREYFPERSETSLFKAIKGAEISLFDCSEAEVDNG